MEQNSDNLLNLSNLPSEIQQEIATYLDAPGLGFFAQSSKRTLKTVLPLLLKYRNMLPVRLAAGGNSTYIYQPKQLFVCGDNRFGQLGLGDTVERSTFTAVPWPDERGEIKQVIAGGSHTLVLTQDDKLWVCGNNHYGQLGLRDTVNRTTFTAVPWPDDRGRIQQISVGQAHSIVLTQDNRLWVCGVNTHYQLGLRETVDRSTFITAPWPDDRGRIEQIVANWDYTVVLTQDNRLWMCGSNEQGQMGLEDKKKHSAFTAVPWPEDRGKIQQCIASWGYTIVLTEDNRLWVCGNNKKCQLGLGDTVDRLTFTTVPWPAERGRIQQIIAGKDHTAVLTQDNRLWMCGNNEQGQLGLADNKKRSAFSAVPWPEDRDKIQQCIAGWGYTIVLTEDKKLWVCGNNTWCQLGLGDKTNRSTFTVVKKLPKFKFNQLIKIGLSLMQIPSIKPDNLHSKHRLGESDDQLLLKKPSCNLQ